ncbi:MAG TPA: OB-fold domain-containing protein [Streptosporangiaceae bacterium]
MTDLGIVRADERSAPFFEAAGRDELLIKRCPACGHWLAPEATACSGCGGAELGWAAASGRGVLVAWAVPHSGKAAAGGVLALVELDEGPWLHTRLDRVDTDAGAGGLRAGLGVAAHFVHPAGGESYPVFRVTA